MAKCVSRCGAVHSSVYTASCKTDFVESQIFVVVVVVYWPCQCFVGLKISLEHRSSLENAAPSVTGRTVKMQN